MEQTAKKKMGLGKKILIAIGVLILIGAIANLGKDEKNSSTSAEAKPANTENHPTIGQPLKTDYFEVTVSKAELKKKIETGNEYLDQDAGEGNQFLIMKTTFKNIDKESRMITDGIVYINYNGKEYEFDNSESLLIDGYGLFLDQINPLTSKTTNLVYKLPAEIKGPAYYKPGRAGDDERIFLGNLN